MTLLWLGGSGVNNWWQGIGGKSPTTFKLIGDLEKLNGQSPKTGDTYLDIGEGILFTYDEEGGTEPEQRWFSIN